MKKFGFFTWFLLVVLAACQTKSNVDNKEVTDEDIARTVEATHVAEIEVSGMTCEMSCGGDIRKALRSTGGVSKVDFDFQKDRETNIARVHYDAQTIQTAEMQRILSELNKGQFTVGNIQNKALPNSNTSAESSGNNSNESGVKMKDSMISLTDLVGIVAAWFL